MALSGSKQGSKPGANVEKARCLPGLSSGFVGISLVIAVLACLNVLDGSPRMKDYDRLLLVQGLAHEIAVAKVPLPWGRHGIHIGSNGSVDQGQAWKELRSKGESVKPGTPVEITDIKFRPGKLLFAINGGGKTGGHWYDHLQIGMGPDVAPMVSSQQTTTPSNGSYITLQLPRNDPKPTVNQVKKLLSQVLDFHRDAPTVLYSPSLPPQFKQAIKKHQVEVGMDRDAVLSAKGAPDRKIRKEKPDGSEEEDWIYGQPPHILFVTMVDGTVTQVHQY
jgi:hypothetical protein